MDLPAQYWLLPLETVQEYMDALDGRCIVFAFDPKVLKAAITFPGNVVIFERAYQARLLLDAWPPSYAVVWGIISRPTDGSAKYHVHPLQFLLLPEGEAPFSDGTFVVGSAGGLAPGPWKTARHDGTPDDGCLWERSSASGRSAGSHLGSALTHATLYAGEGFKTEGCSIWVHVGFSTTGEPVTFVSASEANDPCNNRYDNDGTCHTKDSTWAACLAAGRCYEKYK